MGLSGGLVLNRGNQSQDLYVHALTAAYRSGLRIYDPDLATTTDWEIDEKLQRDPEIKSALEKRWHDVAGRDWNIEPASDKDEDQKAAAIVEDAFKKIEGFTQARYRLAKSSIFGRAFEFTHTDRRMCSLGGTPPQSWLVPTRLQNVDQRRFDFVVRMMPDWEGGCLVPRAVPRLWDWNSAKWDDICCPDVFVQLVYDDEEGRLGYGRGLRESLHFFFRFKTVLLEHGLQGADRWAQGLIVIKIDDTRVGSTDKSNEQIRDDVLAQVKKHRTQHVLAIGKGDELEVYETAGTGHQIVTEMIRDLNESITKVILGSLRPTGGGEGGSLARTSEEAEQTEALIQYDRQLVEEVITRDVIGLIWKYNRSNFRALGLGAARMPVFRIAQKKVENHERNATVIKTLLDAGVSLCADEVYKKTGFTKPRPGDELIEKAAPAPSPFGGGFGGFGAPGLPGEMPAPPSGAPVPPRAPLPSVARTTDEDQWARNVA